MTTTCAASLKCSLRLRTFHSSYQSTDNQSTDLKDQLTNQTETLKSQISQIICARRSGFRSTSPPPPPHSGFAREIEGSGNPLLLIQSSDLISYIRLHSLFPQSYHHFNCTTIEKVSTGVDTFIRVIVKITKCSNLTGSYSPYYSLILLLLQKYPL